MGARRERNAVTLTNMIGKTVTIRCKAKSEWLVTQQRIAGQARGSRRGIDYAQAPAWLRIDNLGKPRKISIHLKWIDFGHMARRKWGYLRQGRRYQVLTAETAPEIMTCCFAAPAGASYFGPIPWYTNEDADRFLQRECRARSICCVRSVGKTRQGREIKCLTIDGSGGSARKNVLIHAREHATETSGSFAVEAIVRHILSKSMPAQFLREHAYHIIPVANPDGVANGTKLPQPGPIELSDLHYAGLTAMDPTCVAIRDEILALKPAVFINYHSYLFPVPQVIYYDKQKWKAGLDVLIGTDPRVADSWNIRRQVHRGDSMPYYCYKHFKTTVGLFELPWAGRRPKEIEALGVKTFLSAMAAARRRK